MGILKPITEWATSPWGQSVPIHIAWFLIWVCALAGLLFLIVHAIYIRYFAKAEEFAGDVSPAFAAAATQEDRFEAFLSVLDRDARDSLAAMELVLAQPTISSQWIDNLNASTHLRALLTDVFLVGEVLRTQRATSILATR